MNVLIIAMMVESTSSGDLAHGVNVANSLIGNTAFSSINLILLHDNERILSNYIKICQSLALRSQKFNFIANSKYTGAEIIQTWLKENPNVDTVLCVASAFLSEHGMDIMLKQHFPNQNTKLICIDEYSLHDYSERCEENSSESSVVHVRTGLGQNESGIFITEPKLEQTISDKIFKVYEITGELGNVHLTYFHADRCGFKEDVDFINKCRVITKVEKRTTTTLIINISQKNFSELNHYFERNGFTLNIEKKDFDIVVYNYKNIKSTEEIKLVNPFHLDADDFQYLLKHTHYFCGVTGDSSFTEALSHKKLIYHDENIWKKKLKQDYHNLLMTTKISGFNSKIIVDFLNTGSFDELVKLYNKIYKQLDSTHKVLLTLYNNVFINYNLNINLLSQIKLREWLIDMAEEEYVKFISYKTFSNIAELIDAVDKRTNQLHGSDNTEFKKIIKKRVLEKLELTDKQFKKSSHYQIIMGLIGDSGRIIRPTTFLNRYFTEVVDVISGEKISRPFKPIDYLHHKVQTVEPIITAYKKSSDDKPTDSFHKGKDNPRTN